MQLLSQGSEAEVGRRAPIAAVQLRGNKKNRILPTFISSSSAGIQTLQPVVSQTVVKASKPARISSRRLPGGPVALDCKRMTEGSIVASFISSRSHSPVKAI